MIPAGFLALPVPVAQLSLAAVLKCGQSFRWSIFPLSTPNDVSPDNSPSHEYRLCLRDRVICLRQSAPDTLFYRAVFPDASQTPTEADHARREKETLAWIQDYFQLDVDLLGLYDQWSTRDPVFEKLRTRFEGIRMLRQDPWENLVSFICSSNNNIARITKMVQSLCKQYSPPLLSMPAPDGTTHSDLLTYHPFPPPSALAKPEVTSVLRSLGFGYRADFIQRTAQMLVDKHGTSTDSNEMCEVSEAWLRTLRTSDTAVAREELLKFVGVGRKVADCVLLMSLDKREVIPVDTHVHQIAIKHYGLRGGSGVKQNMTPALYDEVNKKLMGVWGDHAGWAHSVLFTADLKSFSSYGLPAVILPAKASSKRSTAASSRKRTRATIAAPSAAASANTAHETEDEAHSNTASLAERVKKRRRTTAT